MLSLAYVGQFSPFGVSSNQKLQQFVPYRREQFAIIGLSYASAIYKALLCIAGPARKEYQSTIFSFWDVINPQFSQCQLEVFFCKLVLNIFPNQGLSFKMQLPILSLPGKVLQTFLSDLKEEMDYNIISRLGWRQQRKLGLCHQHSQEIMIPIAESDTTERLNWLTEWYYTKALERWDYLYLSRER